MSSDQKEAIKSRSKQAIATIVALGLDWEGLNMKADPAKSKDLIAEKLAS
jgi:hypothetical protein